VAAVSAGTAAPARGADTWRLSAARDHAPVEDARIGRALRELRRRKHLRQVDVAEIARVSQGTISLIERGHLGRLSVASVRLVFRAVEAGFEGNVIWRGGALDRLLDERHAALVGATIDILRRLGWTVAVEVTYSIYGERGSIDILAGHPDRRVALVVEVKSELTSMEAMGRKLDEKERLVRTRLCEERCGWKPVATGRIVVLPDSDTARRKVVRNRSFLQVLLPVRGNEVRAWLRVPVGDLAGLLFVADTNGRRPSGRPPGLNRVRRLVGRAS
jgi:transcriptional regulator with XRE-family HTH domain